MAGFGVEGHICNWKNSAPLNLENFLKSTGNASTSHMIRSSAIMTCGSQDEH